MPSVDIPALLPVHAAPSWSQGWKDAVHPPSLPQLGFCGWMSGTWGFMWLCDDLRFMYGIWCDLIRFNGILIDLTIPNGLTLRIMALSCLKPPSRIWHGPAPWPHGPYGPTTTSKPSWWNLFGELLVTKPPMVKRPWEWGSHHLEFAIYIVCIYIYRDSLSSRFTIGKISPKSP